MGGQCCHGGREKRKERWTERRMEGGRKRGKEGGKEEDEGRDGNMEGVAVAAPSLEISKTRLDGAWTFPRSNLG